MHPSLTPQRPSDALERETRSVLIVDASESKRLREGFTAFGYEVRSVSGWQPALALLRERLPTLVVSELRLADGSGFRLLQAMQAEHIEVATVIVSAFATVDCALRAIQHGARDCLSKPVTAAQVLLAAQLSQGASERDAAGRWLSLDGASEQYIRDVLALYGSRSRAAEVLGVDRRSLRRRLARYESSLAEHSKPRASPADAPSSTEPSSTEPTSQGETDGDSSECPGSRVDR